MTILRLSALLLCVSFALSSCIVSSTDESPSLPIVKSLKINGDSVRDGVGPIITEARSVVLLAEASSSMTLSRLTISVEKNGSARQTLTECDVNFCEYDWKVSASDNGAYSFFVEAQDERGASSAIPFRNALAIDIR